MIMEFLNFLVLCAETFFRFLFAETTVYGGIAIGWFLVGGSLICMILRFAFGGLWESLFGGDN